MVVCAHPDDELSCAGVMARTIAEQGIVTLVTCTLGERGEVVVPELEYLRSDRDDALGPHRLRELTNAMAALAVTDFVRLGGDGRWRDSGMDYGDHGEVIPASDTDDRCFSRAELLEAATELVAVIRDRRPTVLISDDYRGSYGHPDHVHAHRVATYAADLAAARSYRHDLGEPWTVSRVLWTSIPRSALRALVDLARFTGRDDAPWADAASQSERMMSLAVSDDDIDVRVNGHEFADERFAATAAHATQIPPDGPWFLLKGAPPGELWDECFRLASGVPFPAGARDLFTVV